MNNTLPSLEKIYGLIERVTFHSEESGFFVIRVSIKGVKDLTTIVGSALNINVGEHIEAEGSWINNKTYGVQFKAETFKIVPPTTPDGIEKYLGSGLIKGIGQFTARQLIKAFGDQVFHVLDTAPERIKGLPGIGAKRLQGIITSWQEQKTIREIMVFLQSHGVGTARAVRIYKTYGDDAIAKVRENPYRLARDVYGIGFKTADALAQKLGVPKDSLLRARAGVNYALQEFSNHGHCAAGTEDLIKNAVELLEISEETIQTALIDEVNTGHLILDAIEEKEVLFLAALYQAENNVAKHIQRLKDGVPPWGKINYAEAISWVEKKTGLQLSASQQIAVKRALTTKVMIITGGPGVGKTTIVNSILKIIRAKGINISLCAPTGRAAKRLTETTNIPAKTIHRLLKYDPVHHCFTHGPHDPIPTDFVVVDEASMIDVVLMNNLLKSIPSHAALLIIGDVDQLPSVGPGTVLADLLFSGTVPTVTLTEIFRQAATSKIITNAHRINQGKMPDYGTGNQQEPSDFYVIPVEAPEEIHDKLLYVVTQRIPDAFGLSPLRDIQVLTPMNRSGLGTKSLNIELQGKINPRPLAKIHQFGSTFAVGDKVIQNVNNYDKDVFNGDIGFITNIDLGESVLRVNFYDRSVEYVFHELDEISLAYAITIHKSQGSEYPAIVIPLAMQHYMMLAKNLLYTGITRGKKLVVIIGQTKALGIAVRNKKTSQRLTNLKKRLQIFDDL